MFKRLELKARNGELFSFEKFFKNDNFISFNCDLLNWGLGVGFLVGDSRRFFNLDLLIFHLDVWF